jgi:3-oxoacyl-(acyl-carrier-protein) synthase
VYSHKGALGHSLGASGLVSTALSCLMHRNGVVLPNVRTTQSDRDAARADRFFREGPSHDEIARDSRGLRRAGRGGFAVSG